MQPTVVLGAGGHAKVLIEIMRAAGEFEPVGCLGHAAGGAATVLGVPIWGGDDQLSELRQRGVVYALIAIGDNRIRQMLIERVRQLGFQLARAISPAANISGTARLGEGIAIMPGAHIGTDARLDDGAIINTRAIVDHDCHIGACAHIGPGAALAGSVVVGEQAFVATGASVIPHRTIGARAIVGAGSVVVRDIPADVVAFGVPAKIRRPLADISATSTPVPPIPSTAYRRAG